MSRVNSNQASPMSWSRDASSEVRELRRAITAGPKELEVGRDVAPMMADLLARPFDTDAGMTPRVMPAPVGVDPWAQNPQRAFRQTQSACTNLRSMVQAETDPQKSSRLQRMLSTVEEHMRMRSKIISASTPPE